MATEEEIWKKVSELTPADIVSYLNSLGDSKCPSCGHDVFSLATENGIKAINMILPYSDLDETGTAEYSSKALSAYCSTCDNCGYVNFFACYQIAKRILEKEQKEGHNDK